MSTEFYWVAVAAIIVLSSARLTRLATWDKFPPVLWLRSHYGDWTDKTDRRRQWQVLAYCGYCASFWLTALVVGTGLWAGVFTHEHDVWADVWWLFNGTLGLSYLAAIVMANDGDDGEDD